MVERAVRRGLMFPQNKVLPFLTTYMQNCSAKLINNFHWVFEYTYLLLYCSKIGLQCSSHLIPFIYLFIHLITES